MDVFLSVVLVCDFESDDVGEEFCCYDVFEDVVVFVLEVFEVVFGEVL